MAILWEKSIAEFHPAFIIGFGFVLGFVVVLAEPAVHVLNKQVEEITNGGVSKKSHAFSFSNWSREFLYVYL